MYEIWTRTGCKGMKRKRSKGKDGKREKDHDLKNHDEDKQQGEEDNGFTLKRLQQRPHTGGMSYRGPRDEVSRHRVDEVRVLLTLFFFVFPYHLHHSFK